MGSRLHLSIFVLACVWALLCYVTNIPALPGFVALIAAGLLLLIPPVRRFAKAKAIPVLGVVGGWLVANLVGSDLLPATWPLAPHLLSAMALASGAAAQIAYASGRTRPAVASLLARPGALAGMLLAIGFGLYLSKLLLEVPPDAMSHGWSIIAVVPAAVIGGCALAALAGWQAVAAWHLLGPMPPSDHARRDARLADPDDLRRAGVSRDL